MGGVGSRPRPRAGEDAPILPRRNGAGISFGGFSGILGLSQGAKRGAPRNKNRPMVNDFGARKSAQKSETAQIRHFLSKLIPAFSHRCGRFQALGRATAARIMRRRSRGNRATGDGPSRIALRSIRATSLRGARDDEEKSRQGCRAVERADFPPFCPGHHRFGQDSRRDLAGTFRSLAASGRKFLSPMAPAGRRPKGAPKALNQVID